MAIIGMVFGSFLGFVGGVVGWLMLDMTLLSAFSFYVATSLIFTAMLVLISTLRQEKPFETATRDALQY